MKRILLFLMLILVLPTAFPAECIDYDIDYEEGPLFSDNYVEIVYDKTEIGGTYWAHDQCDTNDPTHKWIIEMECQYENEGNPSILHHRQRCPGNTVCSLGECTEPGDFYCKELPTALADGDTYTDSKYGYYESGDLEYSGPSDLVPRTVNWDYCDQGELYEYYCDGDFLAYEVVECPANTKCLYDRCVPPEKANDQFQCVESNQYDVSPNTHVKGSITKIVENGVEFDNDDLQRSQDNCLDNFRLNEYYCKDGALESWRVDCKPDEFCNHDKDICEPKNAGLTCVDTDKADLHSVGEAYFAILDENGKPIYIKEDSRLRDSCRSEDIVYETNCVNDIPVVEEQDCPADEKCSNRKCIPDEEYFDLNSCSGPSKQEIDYSEKKKITGFKDGEEFEREDYCSGKVAVKVYCDGVRAQWNRDKICPDDSPCFEGMCLPIDGFKCEEIDNADLYADRRIPGSIVVSANGIAGDPIPDECQDNKLLHEWSCKDPNGRLDGIECPAGETCAQDRCLTNEEFNRLYSCTGPTKDTIDYHKKESATGFYNGEEFTRTDFCRDPKTPVNAYCEGNYQSWEWDGWKCLIDTYCDDSICMDKSNFDCTEVDNLDPNADPHVAGSIEIIEPDEDPIVFKDLCSKDKENTLIEYSCDGPVRKREEIRCEPDEICSYGKCMSEAAYDSLNSCFGPSEEEVSIDFQRSTYGKADGQDFFVKDKCKDDKNAIKYYCDGKQLVKDESHGCGETSCFEGMCLDTLEEFSSECNYDGQPCGGECPGGENMCEDTEGKPPGYIPKYIYHPPNEGTCSYGRCLNTNCDVKEIENFEYCNGFVKDSDCDGVMDAFDGCPQDCESNLIALFIDKIEYDENGCQKVELPEEECTYLRGDEESEASLNLVLFPCGFDYGDEGLFYYWAKQIDDILNEVPPFSLEENRKKFTVSYVWDTTKKDVVIGDEIDEIHYCMDDRGVAASRVDSAGCKTSNRLIYQIGNRAFSFDALGWGFIGGDGSGQLGWGSCCPSNPDCCRNNNDHFLGTTLHEMGHGFTFMHLNELKKEYWRNPVYIPEISPVVDEEFEKRLCPIWDYPRFHFFEKETGLKMGCYQDDNEPGLFTDYIKDSLMLSSSVKTDGKWRYDPVSTKLIDDVLRMGYEKYLNYQYPHSCEDFLLDNILNQEDISYLGPEVTDTNKLKKEDIVICFKSACSQVSAEQREECCRPLLENKVYGDKAYIKCAGLPDDAVLPE